MGWKLIKQKEWFCSSTYDFIFEDNDKNKIKVVWDKIRDIAEYKGMNEYTYSIRDLGDIKSILIPILMEILENDKKKSL